VTLFQNYQKRAENDTPFENEPHIGDQPLVAISFFRFYKKLNTLYYKIDLWYNAFFRSIIARQRVCRASKNQFRQSFPYRIPLRTRNLARKGHESRGVSHKRSRIQRLYHSRGTGRAQTYRSFPSQRCRTGGRAHQFPRTLSFVQTLSQLSTSTDRCYEKMGITSSVLFVTSNDFFAFLPSVFFVYRPCISFVSRVSFLFLPLKSCDLQVFLQVLVVLQHFLCP